MTRSPLTLLGELNSSGFFPCFPIVHQYLPFLSKCSRQCGWQTKMVPFWVTAAPVGFDISLYVMVLSLLHLLRSTTVSWLPLPSTTISSPSRLRVIAQGPLSPASVQTGLSRSARQQFTKRLNGSSPICLPLAVMVSVCRPLTCGTNTAL